MVASSSSVSQSNAKSLSSIEDWVNTLASPHLEEVCKFIQTLGAEYPLIGKKLLALQEEKLAASIRKVVDDTNKEIGKSKLNNVTPLKYEELLQACNKSNIEKDKNLGKFHWVDADFLKVIFNVSLNESDIRCQCLKNLSDRCTGILTFSGYPLPVQNFRELSLIELVRKIEFYLKLEKVFEIQANDFDSIIKKIKTLALQRVFCAAIQEKRPVTQARVFEEVIEEDKCIELLSRYPSLQPKFKILSEAIGGMEDLKRTLLFEVMYPMFIKEAAQWGVKPINGILLYGPPGCGKTFIADAFARTIGGHIVQYSMGTHGSSYIHGASIKIQQLFQEAEKKSPSIILIDECSTVFPDRSKMGPSQESRDEEVSQFLQCMEGCAKKQILIIGATNFPQKMDKAILRSGRFDKKFYLSPPDKDSRKKIFQNILKNNMKVDPLIDFEKLASQTANLVCTDIKLVIENALKDAAVSRENVSMMHLENQISKLIPSVSKEVLREYAAIQREMEKKD